MEFREFHDRASRFVALMMSRSPDHNWWSVDEYLHVGEEGEAIDLMVAVLVKDRVPLTQGEADAVRSLVGYFPVSEESARIYRYSSDPTMLDRLNVVDTDGPST